MPMPGDVTELVAQVDRFVQERELATVGDRIVMVAGRALGAPGSMNGILIHTVGTQEELP
jgi:pyruvate kinase